MKKQAVLLSLILLLGACSASPAVVANNPTPTTSNPTPTTSNPTPQTNVQTVKQFTLSELAQYNGKNGTKAYIAISGKVYDVSNVSAWQNGTHQGVKAGADLTKVFANSPHSASMLNGLEIVGALIK